MKRLIVTNGDAAIARLRAAGIDDDMLAWADMLHDGPVPAGHELEELSELRARYLSDDLGLQPDAVWANFRERDSAIRRHGDYDWIELWFEHDLYDQLQLIQLLDFFSAEGRLDGLLLAQADDYLGLQPPESIHSLAAAVRPVSRRQMEAANAAWAAFTNVTPRLLPELADRKNEDLPFLAPALRRLLTEFPANGNGLSLTETRILAGIGDRQVALHALFEQVTEQDEARFLADVPFFRRLDALAFCRIPLIEGLDFPSTRCAAEPEAPDYRSYAVSELAVTEAGRAALADDFDHAVANNIDRWIGGTSIRVDNLWRWDLEKGQLIWPT